MPLFTVIDMLDSVLTGVKFSISDGSMTDLFVPIKIKAKRNVLAKSAVQVYQT